MMKKLSAILLGLALLLTGLSGCTDGVPAPGARPAGDPSPTGIYAGRGRRLMSEIAAHVTLDGGKIVAIDVVEGKDTLFISDKVYEQLPGRIIAHQSLGVDVVTGATLTSFGLIQAVEDALTSAGMDVSAMKAKVSIDFVPAQDETYDVVIVGGGAAGLTAGIGLMTDDALGLTNSGLKVLLLERLAYTGGAIRVSDGLMMALNNTPYNDLIGQSTSDDALIDFAKTLDKNNTLNEALFRNVLKYAPAAYNGLLNRGLYLPPENTKPGYIYGNEALPCAYYFTVRNPYTGEGSFRDDEGFDYGSNAGSPWLAQSLENAAKTAGVEIRTDAAVERLIMDGDRVVGVHVKDKNSHTEYDVKAKSVVLATGMLGADRASLEKWSTPDSVKAVHFGAAGHKGDGHRWAEELGGTVFNGEMVHFVMGFDRIGHYGPATRLHRHAPSIWVNREGNRFFNEGGTRKPSGKYGILQQTDNMVFGLIDSDNPYVAYMDDIIPLGLGWEADTLEALAEKIRVDYPGLEKTVAAYNAAYDAGGDDAGFGTLNSEMAPLKKGPFYAFQVRGLSNGVSASVRADEQCRILRQDGSTVPGVYLAGSIMVGNYAYMDGGLSHMTALSSGAYVAHLVRTDLAG